MGHHGQDPLFGDPQKLPDEIKKLFNEASAEKLRTILGDTGQYPQGALTKDDEGEIKFAIGVKDGKVCIDFGKPVAWLGMDADQAIEMAQLLVKQAANAKGRPITMRLELQD